MGYDSDWYYVREAYRLPAGDVMLIPGLYFGWQPPSTAVVAEFRQRPGASTLATYPSSGSTRRYLLSSADDNLGDSESRALVPEGYRINHGRKLIGEGQAVRRPDFPCRVVAQICGGAQETDDVHADPRNTLLAA